MQFAIVDVKMQALFTSRWKLVVRREVGLRETGSHEM
jgi:hypothetical protein